jgi:hypothetical protein
MLFYVYIILNLDAIMACLSIALVPFFSLHADLYFLAQFVIYYLFSIASIC